MKTYSIFNTFGGHSPKTKAKTKIETFITTKCYEKIFSEINFNKNIVLLLVVKLAERKFPETFGGLSSSSSWWWWLKKILVNVFHQLKHEKKWNQTSEKKILVLWFAFAFAHIQHLWILIFIIFWYTMQPKIIIIIILPTLNMQNTNFFCCCWNCQPASHHDDDDHYDSFGDIVFFSSL